MKVLLVYESLETPSTTVRALQFRECFEQDAQIQATFIGRTSEAMNAVMKRWPWRPSLRRPATVAESAILRRRESKIVDLARRCDVVMMMTVPSWPLHQRLADLPNTRLITDLIDALWLPCFQSQGWQHIHQMLATSDTVICENEYTAGYVRDHCPNVSVVPDGPQLDVFDRHRDSVVAPQETCRIGWIGGKYTADALYRVFEPLESIFAQHPDVQLRLVGADPDRIPRFENVRYSVLPQYDQTTMVREVLAMDIGIFPMFNTAESLYRGTLKTKIYMSGQAAVIGQRLGENETLIQDGVNGLLAADDQQWCDALSRLIGDVPLRRQVAAAGLETMRRDFTRQRCYQRLRDAILDVQE
ncbi:hypothetical protein Mal15_34720 [Stieleria maiorica]|uniref:Glycosyl transferases group 1 n=1 Tax=Stieleria maiorica TaxID=2795974 RepID=A0A5B9ME82_9BACT|nr:glycosyltransferase family 4 protein [Stieleria maiorica]QEF99408.1 hypothetical protein Mal15_34720 [Stieleria maiorica]